MKTGYSRERASESDYAGLILSNVGVPHLLILVLHLLICQVGMLLGSAMGPYAKYLTMLGTKNMNVTAVKLFASL